MKVKTKSIPFYKHYLRIKDNMHRDEKDTVTKKHTSYRKSEFISAWENEILLSFKRYFNILVALWVTFQGHFLKEIWWSLETV